MSAAAASASAPASASASASANPAPVPLQLTVMRSACFRGLVAAPRRGLTPHGRLVLGRTPPSTRRILCASLSTRASKSPVPVPVSAPVLVLARLSTARAVCGPPAAIRLHTSAKSAASATSGASAVAGESTAGPASEAEPEPAQPPYTPPTRGLLARLPASWVPYAELTRMDKPTGSYYLFFPCLFSTLMAAPLAAPAMASPAAVLGTSALFLTGALIMRGAGCTINDLWDRNLDPHVSRTRLRPIARGAVTPGRAVVFTGVQLLAGLAVLLQFPPVCLAYGVPSLVLVAAYPLAKRVTYYPQFVLGLTFSWGAIMGFPALGVDLLADASARTAAALLYASNVAWTVLYDMIYAHMDLKDDAKAGIKSIALKHAAQTKAVLSGLAVVQIGLLAGAGVAAGAGPAFFVGSCGGGLATLAVMIRRVRLESVQNCWWWFVNGCLLTGGAISLGLGADYLIRYRQGVPDKAQAERAVEA